MHFCSEKSAGIRRDAMNDANPHLAVTRGALFGHLEPELERRSIVLDPAQERALERL